MKASTKIKNSLFLKTLSTKLKFPSFLKKSCFPDTVYLKLSCFNNNNS